MPVNTRLYPGLVEALLWAVSPVRRRSLRPWEVELLHEAQRFGLVVITTDQVLHNMRVAVTGAGRALLDSLEPPAPKPTRDERRTYTLPEIEAAIAATGHDAPDTPELKR